MAEYFLSLQFCQASSSSRMNSQGIPSVMHRRDASLAVCAIDADPLGMFTTRSKTTPGKIAGFRSIQPYEKEFFP